MQIVPYNMNLQEIVLQGDDNVTVIVSEAIALSHDPSNVNV